MSRGWGELLRGENAARSAVVGGGMVIHAISTFIVITILPTIVRDIGGLRFFAWNTTLYVVASLLGGAACARILARVGPRNLYRMALALFAIGTAACALAPSMPVLLAARFVQGLGAGTLSGLSFTMVRTLFPAPLWPRALTITSAMWGIATLGGPAIGGIYAQYDAWRAAFWSVFAAVPLMLLLVERSLPRDLARPTPPRTPMAWLNLAILAGSALAVSAGSSSSEAPWNAAGLAVAAAGFILFVRLESGGRWLLPHGACNPAQPLGAAYAAMMMLIVGVTIEIFVPYFLQVLHGMAPLNAGYVSALLSGGWTASALFTSVLSPRLGRVSMVGGPLVLAAGLAGLFLWMPQPGDHPELRIWLIGLCLAGVGFGIGMSWPHLGTRVFTLAAEADKELAATSITVLIMVSNGFGSALGGMVTNLAGLTVPGGAPGAASAATWLFGVFVAAPLLAFLAARRLRAVQIAVA